MSRMAIQVPDKKVEMLSLSLRKKLDDFNGLAFSSAAGDGDFL